MDSLRADQLGRYGSNLHLTPVMDGIASGGARFDTAISHSPWTLPAVASLYTSKIPGHHSAGKTISPFQFQPLKDEHTTLAQVLKQNGYRTGAVVNVDFLTEAFGMSQGFEKVDFSGSMTDELTRNASETADAASDMMNEFGDDPFFMVVHFFDPHLTYDPPKKFRKRFAKPADRNQDGFIFGTHEQMMELRRGITELPEDVRDRLKALYQAEIAYTDSQIGVIVKKLKSQGIINNTLIVITADHGEEFGDHGGFEHGHTLYDELLHVPLIFHLPDVIPFEKSIKQTVRQIDIAPTILDILEIQENPDFAGDSLLPFINASDANRPDRSVFSEGNFWGPNKYAWRSGNYKLIHEPDENRSMVFDIRNDRDEQTDISETHPEIVRPLMENLSLIVKNLNTRDQSRENQESAALTDDELNRLRELGYIL